MISYYHLKPSKAGSALKKRAFLYVILAGIFWGTSGIFSTLLAECGLTGLQNSAVRGTVSLLFLLVYVLIFDRRAFRIHLWELALFFGIGIALFGSGTAYFYAIPRTSNATAVVLMYTAPVIVSVVSVLFLGERFSRFKLLSVAVMLLGCLFVSGVIGDLKIDLIGILLGLLSGVSYAAYNILTKIAMKRGSSAISATFYGVAFMTLLALLFSAPGEILALAAAKPLPTIPLMLGIGLVTFVAPYLLYTFAMRTLPAGTACALSIVEPMAATVFSMIIFREIPSPLSALGIVLILLAVFLLGKEQNGTHESKQKRKQKQ